VRYPLGRAVAVHYDPANPGNAALENPTEFSWMPFLLTAASFAVAAYAAGLIG
jgi:hypothetical protein